MWLHVAKGTCRRQSLPVPLSGLHIFFLVALFLSAVSRHEAARCGPACGLCGIPPAATMSAEDRRLSRMDPVELARQTVKGRRFEPISRRLDDASPPSEIVIVSMALPESSSFLDEAVLMDAVIDEINNDPDIFPNTTVRGLVMSEGTTVTSLLETLEFAYSAGACLTTGVTTGTRQAIMGSAAAVSTLDDDAS
mmetsp:Transcript_24613/g.37404  ORF Transcript_24613/g.37404 Transcript_24613/m.37404 type:complete len:194 (+) Transcript_24613:91-672(+)